MSLALVSAAILRFAYQKVDSLLVEHNIKGPPIGLGPLADVHGMYHKIELPMELSGLLQRRKEGYVVAIDSQSSRARKNFTMAHELAHMMILETIASLKPIDQILARIVDEEELRSNTNYIETLCDEIASELLMPTRFFVPLARAGVQDLASLRKLCVQFEASPEAVLMRLHRAKLWGRMVGIVWRMIENPLKRNRGLVARPSKKLRIDWAVSLGHWAPFVPRFKPAKTDSSIYQTYGAGGLSSYSVEELHLGTLRGKFIVESTRFGHGPNRYVVSLIKEANRSERGAGVKQLSLSDDGYNTGNSAPY